MRGSGKKSCRPVTQSILASLMKHIRSETELLRLAAYLVQGRQAVEDEENSVLQSLGHDRTGVLLEFQNKALVLGPGLLVKIIGKAKEQYVAHEIENRCFNAWITSLGRNDGAFNHL